MAWRASSGRPRYREQQHTPTPCFWFCIQVRIVEHDFMKQIIPLDRRSLLQDFTAWRCNL